MGDHQSADVKKLDDILKGSHRATEPKYLRVLQMASRPSGVTTNEIASRLHEKPQNVHPFLKRLTERQGIIRKKGKQDAEFHYYLAPGVSLEEVEDRLKKLSSDKDYSSESDPMGFIDREIKEVGMNTKENLLEYDREMVLQQIVERREKIQLRQSQVSKLPEFDPEWSSDIQKAWFDAFKSISSVESLDS